MEKHFRFLKMYLKAELELMLRKMNKEWENKEKGKNWENKLSII